LIVDRAMNFEPETEFPAGDHILGLSWSADGEMLAVTPASGPIIARTGERTIELADHGLGNGAAKFHPAAPALATSGTDGRVRLYADVRVSTNPAWDKSFGRSWIERLAWSPDGAHLAAGSGRRLLILDAGGDTALEFSTHKSTVEDFAWNPQNPREIASVCDGGAHMWRLGETEPFARFDWGGASLLASWSDDGRWLVTGDQTPSVHLYDFTRDYPLHIQGYETKVKALSFNGNSRKLATGGGSLVTVWTCTGKTGPEGSVPRQLQGHTGDVLALAYRPGGDWLVSGGADARLILFEPETSAQPRAGIRLDDAITAVAWHPAEARLAAATKSGVVRIFRFS
jgi:WD40 repeat protein